MAYTLRNLNTAHVTEIIEALRDRPIKSGIEVFLMISEQIEKQNIEIAKQQQEEIIQKAKEQE